MGICYMSQETQTGTLYQPIWMRWGGRWDGGAKGREYMYTYGWFMLRFDRKQQNSVKQLSFNKTNKLIKEREREKEREMQFWSLGWEDPLEKAMVTCSSILAWKIIQRSLMGYSPWGCKESDMTEQLNWIELNIKFKTIEEDEIHLCTSGVWNTLE